MAIHDIPFYRKGDTKIILNIRLLKGGIFQSYESQNTILQDKRKRRRTITFLWSSQTDLLFFLDKIRALNFSMNMMCLKGSNTDTTRGHHSCKIVNPNHARNVTWLGKVGLIHPKPFHHVKFFIFLSTLLQYVWIFCWSGFPRPTKIFLVTHKCNLSQHATKWHNRSRSYILSGYTRLLFLWQQKTNQVLIATVNTMCYRHYITWEWINPGCFYLSQK